MNANPCEANDVFIGGANPCGLEVVIDPPALAAHFDVAISTIQRWVDAGDFPKPMRIGRRLLRWRVADVNDWLAKQSKQETEME